MAPQTDSPSLEQLAEQTVAVIAEHCIDWSRRDFNNEKAEQWLLSALHAVAARSQEQETDKTQGLLGTAASDGEQHPPSTPSDREQCICSAIRLENGEVWRGHRHNDAIHTAGNAGVSRKDIAAAEQGFITSRNRFVGRQEAALIQWNAQIPSADSGARIVKELYSEDLYLRSWRSPDDVDGGQGSEQRPVEPSKPSSSSAEAERDTLTAQVRTARVEALRDDDLSAVVDFVLGWFPGYEDAIRWGGDGSNGSDPATNAVYQAALRLRDRASREEQKPEHVCGLQGYNGMVDPPCPACAERARRNYLHRLHGTREEQP